MSREVHVRFCEGPGVRFLRATHPKLLGPAKWSYFYLYVLLDIFSRYVVGWMVAHRESATLAKKLIAESASKQAIERGQLTVHADRRSSMTSKPVALLLADLGVTKSHSRPSVSNDNPFSEAQFKTLKYWPEFPDRFGSIEDARAFCVGFFDWYNNQHYHSARVAHAGDGALRRGRDGNRAPRGSPGRRLRGASRAVRTTGATAGRAADCGLDQPAEAGGRQWRSTVITLRRVSQTC